MSFINVVYYVKIPRIHAYQDRSLGIGRGAGRKRVLFQCCLQYRVIILVVLKRWLVLQHRLISVVIYQYDYNDQVQSRQEFYYFLLNSFSFNTSKGIKN